ncbi:hypothetical protein BWP39_28975 [Paraburkholderia acidicola]|uniref:YcaO domain-containing protein n=1 Tax=Paraburkholderia acidicola TaxID=1912599 RepID=A0A2A4ESA4_9BURK|nr:YcaO-like family protein [Paraburkholderia acidicola]PCE23715.1 hypothetical protein BWP39_28975 [Paraburkholderia acidicola]
MMQTEAATDPVTQGLTDPERVFPILAAPAWIKGNTLSMRLAGEKIELRAPRHYLAKLTVWCQGDMTLAQIEQACLAQWGDRYFIQFVEDLLAAGVLIDVPTLLLHAVRETQHPDRMGQPADEIMWRNAAQPLPHRASIDTKAIKLPPREPSALSSLIAQRRSATIFGVRTPDRVDLSRLLHSAYGLHEESDRRSVASAGGFYPLTLHLILLRGVDSIAPGTYLVRFDSDGGVYLQHEHDEHDSVPSLIYHPHLLRQAVGMIVISGALLPGTLKYGNRSYPFAMLEAGQIIQNIALSAIEQKLGWRALGGLDYSRMAAHCRLPEACQVLIAGVFGSLPETGDAAARPHAGQGEDGSDISSRIEFLWNDEISGLPFHLGMARIKGHDGEADSSFSWGRDANAWHAYDKALAETVERHAYRQPRELRSARWDELNNVCDPRKIAGYRALQYRYADFPFKPFDPRKPYLWLEATHLANGSHQWVPAECVLHPKALPASYLEQCLTDCSSSGCASGSSLEMAQHSALFEVIERDAFMRHWFAQRGGEEVAIESLPLPFQQRVEQLRSRGCRVSLQLLDLAVQPVWMVVVQHDEKHFTSVGAAAGLAAERALHSALSEAETGANARLVGFKGERVRPAEVTTPAHHADLYALKRYYRRADALLETGARIAFHDIVQRQSPDMFTVYADLAARGLDPLWVDLSLSDAPQTLTGHTLVSGRVIVPGLIPVAFGTLRLPLGMDTYRKRAARFPHPFP